MLRDKLKSIPYSKYVELIKPNYTYIKIVPDRSIRNYNSSNIAKAIAYTFKAINKRIRIDQKKVWIELNYKITYIVDIEKNDVSFYFILPSKYKSIIVEKVREIWSKVTIEEVEKLKGYTANAVVYQLGYKKEDALSLNVDKKSNEPLNSLLSVTDIMKDTDRVTIIYNFLPIGQLGWKKRYEDTMAKLKNNKPIEREKISTAYISKFIISVIMEVLESVFSVLNDFMGGNKQSSNKEVLSELVATMIEKDKSLSVNTKKKKEGCILDLEMLVVSESDDITRKENNALSVCQAYRSVEEDNELIYKKVNTKYIDIEKYKITNADRNTISTDEAQNFIQLPGRNLLNDFNINHIKSAEVIVPKELQSGTKSLGIATTKGIKTIAFLENKYNVGNLPLVLVGPQGGGKTTYIGNYSNYCSKANESVIVLDFIKNCELSESIKQVVPQDRVVEIDLGKECSIQGFGYNEMSINSNMTTFEKIEIANIQSQQLMNLIDSISVGDPLSSKMRNILGAAATVTFINNKNSVKDVVKCLEREDIRNNYINTLSNDIKGQLEEEIRTLNTLNDYDKKTGELVGTRENKIEFVLDRISMLREDFKLKYMYNKDCKDNVDLVECMEQNKVVLIKMRDSDFPNRMAKNVLITYWISKVWLASQLRGKLHEKPTRTNIIIDEVFQAPTSLEMLEYILPQSRKFGTKFIFSTQYMKQLKQISEALDASGASYMLLRGSTEQDFNHFKAKIGNFEYEDLKDAGEFTSLNIVFYSQGTSAFITKLPKPIVG